jgi:hypothetical protein
MSSSSALRRWGPTLGIAVLGFAATVTNLKNQFTYDDIPIITENPSVKSLHTPWVVFTEPYWPKPYRPDLYRPLSTLSLAAQYRLGGGRPWVFHAVSILEYVLVCVALYRLAAGLLAPPAAWISAALFAVHPVHVEATAIGVNQSELLVALLLILAVYRYLAQRIAGDIRTGTAVGLTTLYVAACLVKENGIVLPGLLVAAELTVIRDGRRWKDRLSALRPFYLGLTLAAVAFLKVRSLILESVAGTYVGETFRGLTSWQRAMTMLGVVKDWLRLMLLPLHLQTDYTPREIEGAVQWGSEQTLGLVLLLALVGITLLALRRRPVAGFGLLWVGVALVPVSNVLIPTGIALAERSLFLASAGMMMLVGVGIEWLDFRLKPAAARLAVTTALGALIIAAGTFSARRQFIWRDQHTLFNAMKDEAPLSYKAHWGIGYLLFKDGQQGAAEREYRTAISLFPYSAPLYANLADRYREAGFCEPAIPLYYHSLMLLPEQAGTRSSLIACLTYLGNYPAARRLIRLGYAFEKDLKNLDRFRRTVDSAVAVGAPPRTVRFTVDTTAGK